SNYIICTIKFIGFNSCSMLKKKLNSCFANRETKTKGMKKHNGMRPHDIVILLKIVAKGNHDWLMKDIANELFISNSEVSESLNRSVLAGLIASDKKRVMRQALVEFITSGLKYVYP